MYTHLHIYMITYLHIYIFSHTNTHVLCVYIIYIYIYIHTYIHTHIHTYIHTYIHILEYILPCKVHVCVRVCVYTHTYIHTHRERVSVVSSRPFRYNVHRARTPPDIPIIQLEFVDGKASLSSTNSYKYRFIAGPPRCIQSVCVCVCVCVTLLPVYKL